MTELDRIDVLTKKMVSIWTWCWGNASAVRGQEAERTRDRRAWNHRMSDLESQVTHYLEEGQVSLDDLEKICHDPELVWLAVLDRVLSQYRLDVGGGREPPPVLPPDNDMKWVVFPRRRPLGETVHQKQSYHIRNCLLHHCIIPTMEGGVEIRVLTNGSYMQHDLMSLLDSRRPMRCYLGSFADGIQPDWGEKPDGKCICSELKEPDVRCESLRQALEEARDMQADVVVLPELSLCSELRHYVSHWLQNNSHPFCMVVPGSFHELPDKEGVPVNRTRLLDGKGREVLFHDKIIPFGTDKDCDEVIRPGNCLRLLNTPVGLMALAICRDFLEGDDSMALPWQKVAPDWVFVPSMSPIQGVRSHEDRAKSLSNCCATRSLVPNQCPFGTYAPDHPGEKGNSHGFASWYDTQQGKFTLRTIEPLSRLVEIPF